jgi:hypothetical protein
MRSKTTPNPCDSVSRQSHQEGLDQEGNLFGLDLDFLFSACAGANEGSGSEWGESEDDDDNLGWGAVSLGPGGRA